MRVAISSAWLEMYSNGHYCISVQSTSDGVHFAKLRSHIKLKHRVVIPVSLRLLTLEVIHAAHQGVSSMNNEQLEQHGMLGNNWGMIGSGSSMISRRMDSMSGNRNNSGMSNRDRSVSTACWLDFRKTL